MSFINKSTASNLFLPLFIPSVAPLSTCFMVDEGIKMLILNVYLFIYLCHIKFRSVSLRYNYRDDDACNISNTAASIELMSKVMMKTTEHYGL